MLLPLRPDNKFQLLKEKVWKDGVVLVLLIRPGLTKLKAVRCTCSLVTSCEVEELLSFSIASIQC